MKAFAAAAAIATLFSLPAYAQGAGDPAEGEKVFKKCAICHAVGEGAKNKVGPILNGVIGRQPGTLPDYKYSPAMVEYGQGKVWDEANLSAYLENPRAVVPKGKMAFVGLKKPEERANVIAYLNTFSEKK